MLKSLGCQRDITTKHFRYLDCLQELWDDILGKGKVDSEVRGQAIVVQVHMKSFNFFFGIQLGVLNFMHTDNLSSTIQYTHDLNFDTTLAIPKHRK